MNWRVFWKRRKFFFDNPTSNASTSQNHDISQFVPNLSIGLLWKGRTEKSLFFFFLLLSSSSSSFFSSSFFFLLLLSSSSYWWFTFLYLVLGLLGH